MCVPNLNFYHNHNHKPNPNPNPDANPNVNPSPNPDPTLTLPLPLFLQVFWGVGSVFDLNREYKYRELDSPGLAGRDVRDLAPLIVGRLELEPNSNPNVT